MSVVETDRYRRAFRARALGQPLGEADRAVLERARAEASLPPGHYPMPCGPAWATPPADETATARIDTPLADPTRRGPTRWTRWVDDTETR